MKRCRRIGRLLALVGAVVACSPPQPSTEWRAANADSAGSAGSPVAGGASPAAGGASPAAGGIAGADSTALGGTAAGDTVAGNTAGGNASGAGTGGVAGVPRRLLYVVSPGIRNYVEWGGKGVLVFDLDDGHRFLRRIASPFSDVGGEVENVKGVAANAENQRLYITTLTRVAAINLATDETLWVKKLDAGCDRLAISQDGRFLYVPSLEGATWAVLNASDGEPVRTLVTNQKAHNTLAPPGSNRVYLAGIGSPNLVSVDPATHEVIPSEQVGPFGNPIRPFSISMARGLVVANVNDLLGFEVGSLETGKKLFRVEVPGFSPGPYKRHGMVSHGVGVNPDDTEVWVVDAPNQQVHVFDLTKMPPEYKQSVALAVDQPGWITFSIRGDYAYPSTGEVIDARTKKIVAWLKDKDGDQVQSEKLLEIDFDGQRPVAVGDQFGVGRSHL